MEKVTGFGGLFFQAHDPEKLAVWYEKHLGVKQVPQSYEEDSWKQEAGPTVFAPFNKTNEYLNEFGKALIFNFRVRNLDAMIAQLEGAGISVKTDSETYPNGRFAHLSDPEGNPIQLWEPAGNDR